MHVEYLRWLLASAWRSVPIAEFDWTLPLDSQLSADSTRPEALRPENLALLAGCSREDRGRVKRAIDRAPGDLEETFRRNERAVLQLLDDLACPAAKEMLRQALERARMVTSHGDEAEVVRDAAQSLLEAIERVDVVESSAPWRLEPQVRPSITVDSWLWLGHRQQNR